MSHELWVNHYFWPEMTKWLVSEIIGSVQARQKSSIAADWMHLTFELNLEEHESCCMTGETATLCQWCYFGNFIIFSSVTNIDATVSLRPCNRHSKPRRLQWCNWRVMVTELRCWWQIHYVGDFFSLLAFEYVKLMSNMSKLSPIDFVSNSGHQHRSSKWLLADQDISPLAVR